MLCLRIHSWKLGQLELVMTKNQQDAKTRFALMLYLDCYVGNDPLPGEQRMEIANAIQQYLSDSHPEYDAMEC